MHERPGVTRDRNEIECECHGMPVCADRHRRDGLSATRTADGLDPRAGPGRPGRRAGRRAGLSTRVRVCGRATRSSPSCCAAGRARSSSLPTSAIASRTWRSRRSFTASGWASRSRSRPRRASARATCSTGSSRCSGRAPWSRRRTTVRLPVIGRPNVGKSSLVNRFLGEQRVTCPSSGHDPGRDRHAADRRRSPPGADRHGRHPSPGQGV